MNGHIKLTVFISKSHDSVHIISIIHNKRWQVFHIYTNIRPFFHLEIFNTSLSSALVHLYKLDESIYHLRGIFIGLPLCKRCRPISDTLFAASALGMHRLQRSINGTLGTYGLMHLSMFSPRGGWLDYPRELDNFEKNRGLIPYPCDTILCLKFSGHAFKFRHNFEIF